MNARKELEDIISSTGIDVDCAALEINVLYQAPRAILLMQGYSMQDLSDFMNRLDFEYDNGYGDQLLYGTVWCRDGTWLYRHEYDGSECWIHAVCPKIDYRLKFGF